MSFPSLTIGDLFLPVALVQGGMGVGISLSGLASAVAASGGLGVISAAGIGVKEPDFSSNYIEANNRTLAREIRAVRAKTAGALGVNIMVAMANFADLVKTALRENVDVIFSGAGLPLDLPSYLTEGSKTKLVPIISSARAAVILCKKWLSRFGRTPDAFVVEGPMAGGHLGFKAEQIDDPAFALEKLVTEVVAGLGPYTAPNGLPIPVIAAGGVYTGADIRRFITLGAAGVQMGTRFVATDECDADERFKQTYIAATEQDLVIIKSPVGMPGRAIRNGFLERVANGDKTPSSCPYHCIHSCEHGKAPYCITLALANAQRGRLTQGFAFAGQNAWRVDRIMPVAELFEELTAQYAQAEAAALLPQNQEVGEQDATQADIVRPLAASL
ncbi:2-nitropropane dioxygenase NPD [Solidesulfovibrio fructosivorans JJ]]|uniref:2-nitropropane dioxygenase NPD n=1 Tax=Solidesulfovibrio fructosivorans JJ] TaxID=596151 RepID=E1JQW8_SOLFR|nr:nitronate monooxygenase family protein [Solidesulfovibrio fructosivorans]EFL52969.1 2-nitropropane dioxygenase NPD [Solidesulfovibrio fructosivorans JJ]]